MTAVKFWRVVEPVVIRFPVVAMVKLTLIPEMSPASVTEKSEVEAELAISKALAPVLLVFCQTESLA